MLYQPAREDQAATTTLGLLLNYRSQWYAINLTNSTVVYSKAPTDFKLKIKQAVC